MYEDYLNCSPISRQDFQNQDLNVFSGPLVDKDGIKSSTLDCGESIPSSLSSIFSIPSTEATSTGMNKIVVGENRGTSNNDSGHVKKQATLQTICGIHIVNPLIENQIIEHLHNHNLITFNILELFVKNARLDMNWLIAGVVTRTTFKTSSNNTKYCIWKVSDLKHNLKSINVFLCRSAYKNFCETAIGMAVSILNPKIINKISEISLSVSDHSKIVTIGQSKDYSIYKNTAAVVHKSLGEFCLNHFKEEYQSFSNHAVLQSGVKKQAHYLKGLCNTTLIEGSKSATEVQKHLQHLNGLSKDKTIGRTKQIQANNKQHIKDMERLRQLESSTPFKYKDIAFDAEVLPNKTEEAAKDTLIKNLHVLLPKIASTTFSKVHDTLNNSDSTNDINKIVLKWIQTNNLCSSTNLRKRPLDTTESISNSKIYKMQENQAFSDRVKNMMATSTTSSCTNLGEKYEPKQKERMSYAKGMPCKLVKCLKCKRTDYLASKLCRDAQHPLKIINGIKSKCFNCGITNFDVVPIETCKNCDYKYLQQESRIEIGATKPNHSMFNEFIDEKDQFQKLDIMMPD